VLNPWLSNAFRFFEDFGEFQCESLIDLHNSFGKEALLLHLIRFINQKFIPVTD